MQKRRKLLLVVLHEVARSQSGASHKIDEYVVCFEKHKEKGILTMIAWLRGDNAKDGIPNEKIAKIATVTDNSVSRDAANLSARSRPVIPDDSLEHLFSRAIKRKNDTRLTSSSSSSLITSRGIGTRSLYWQKLERQHRRDTRLLQHKQSVDEVRTRIRDRDSDRLSSSTALAISSHCAETDRKSIQQQQRQQYVDISLPALWTARDTVAGSATQCQLPPSISGQVELVATSRLLSPTRSTTNVVPVGTFPAKAHSQVHAKNFADRGNEECSVAEDASQISRATSTGCDPDLDSQCNTPISPSTTTSTTTPSSSIIMVEIAPGCFARLRGAQETWECIQHNFFVPVTCWVCLDAVDLCCIQDAHFVLCPRCKVISPMPSSSASFSQMNTIANDDANSHHHGRISGSNNTSGSDGDDEFFISHQVSDSDLHDCTGGGGDGVGLGFTLQDLGCWQMELLQIQQHQH